MVELEEKDFIKGGKTESLDALLISEDCNGFIDSVLDQIYGLNLTPEQQKELGVEVYKEKYDDSWKRVVFAFEPGNEIIFSRYERKCGNEISKTTHGLTCHGQLDSDRVISILTGFGFVGSHTLFSYDENCEVLYFNQGIEKEIIIKDGEEKLTQYAKLGFTKRPVFSERFGQYSHEYLDRDSYKEEYVNGKSKYFDLDGKPLTQPEVVATTFSSFDLAYASFNEKLMRCRQLIDLRLKEITDRKIK